MKDWVARVMQISYLNIDQIERLHAQERRLGYILPNFAAQEFLGVMSIKEACHIPMNDELQRLHADRIEKMAKAEKLLPLSSETDEEGGNVGWIHALDFNVHRNPKNLVFEYSGPKGRTQKGRLYDAVSRGEKKASEE